MRGGLHLEIEASDLLKAGEELGASVKQVKFAFSRATRRTAATLRRMSERGIKSEMELRSITYIRKRLRSIKIRQGKDGSVGLWYGLNDMPIPEFKGTPKETATGATFRSLNVKGGFVAKDRRGRKTIFKREGKARLPITEQLVPVKDRLDVFIEDRIFDEVEQIFWKHFMQDLNARVQFGLGQTDYR
jgi:hypothetical protein